jgi:hypothetical protein
MSFANLVSDDEMRCLLSPSAASLEFFPGSMRYGDSGMKKLFRVCLHDQPVPFRISFAQVVVGGVCLAGRRTKERPVLIDQITPCNRPSYGTCTNGEVCKVWLDLPAVKVFLIQKFNGPIHKWFSILAGNDNRSLNLAALYHPGGEENCIEETKAGVGNI